MAYIGNSLTQQSFTGGMDQFNGNASNTTFGLSRTINTPFDVNVYVEGVFQRPGVAYTVSANTITFTSAPSTGANNVVVVYENFTSTSIVPAAGSVTPSTIAANTIQATLGYVPANKAGDTFTGAVTIGSGSNNYFTINGSISSGQPAYISAAGTDSNVGIDFNTKAAGDFRINTNSTNRLIISGANGNVGVGNNTPGHLLSVAGSAYIPNGVAGVPVFYARQSAAQTFGNGTNAKITYDTKVYDTANAYTGSTTSRFQPTIAGYYWLNATVRHTTAGAASCDMSFYVNGSAYISQHFNQQGTNDQGAMITAIVYLNGSQYVEVWYNQNGGNSVTTNFVDNLGNNNVVTWWQGVLIRAA